MGMVVGKNKRHRLRTASARLDQALSLGLAKEGTGSKKAGAPKLSELWHYAGACQNIAGPARDGSGQREVGLAKSHPGVLSPSFSVVANQRIRAVYLRPLRGFFAFLLRLSQHPRICIH